MMTEQALAMYTRKKLRRRLVVTPTADMPPLGCVEVQDRYVCATTRRLMTIYLLLTGPCAGQYFKLTGHREGAA